MMTVQVVLLLGVLVSGCVVVVHETGRQRTVARGLVRLAGAVNGHRRAEFLGELSMLQDTTDDSGLDYAFGAVLAATVERVSLRHPLRVEAVSKAFGLTQAVDAVSLEIPSGAVTALVGANGAGKSTLINLIAGVDRPDSGAITCGGVAVGHAQGGRVALVRHELGLFDDLTVADNIALGSKRGNWIVSARAENERACAALRQMGVSIDPRSRVGDLAGADRCFVAIARAVQSGCRLLVLDEPSADFSLPDTARLHEVMAELRRRGIGIVFATHCLDQVFEVADRVAVLRDGRLVHESEISATDSDELIRQIVGADQGASD